jgi:lipopolysaccharide/colanic/teichoic acid biosynthesis glycosyltransferase
LLDKTAKVYKRNATKTKKKFVTRRCCLWSGSIVVFIVLAVGIFLILWLWLGVIKF